MATDILYNVKNEERKSDYSEHAGRKCYLNGSDDMAKSHDLLVMLG